MMKKYFDDLVSGIETTLRENPEAKSARKIYAREIAKLGSRLYSGEERIAWCGVTAPFDLLSCLGVTSCFVEFIGAMLASTGMIGEFLEEAEHEGYAGDTCGYHRAVIGAMKKDLMPEPDFLIATNVPCTGGLAVMETIADHFKKDLFALHIPQEQTDKNVRYLADQLKEMVAFVSSHTGQNLDDEKLRNAILNTNKARAFIEEAYKLAMNVPSPANGRVLGNYGIVIALLLGTKAGVEVAKALRDDFAAKVERNESGVSGERIRLMWIQNRIQFKNPLINLLENEYGAAVISDELNSITWDPINPDDPYTGLAIRSISIPFNGSVDRRINHLKKLAKEYKIDGAINPCHWGCRQGTGARGLITDGLKEVGVPVLNLETDCVDSRNFSEGQLRTRLEAFTEMLENRPSPWV
ncbi:MAG: 2-hydroxyacyl-CoA dehydratase [Deltaproteobacteria bacterium]|nr:2-hydroxyacyl-CoA dehydratase [Deltaproteobacteria bacterium]